MRAIEALQHFGVSTEDLYSKSLDEMRGKTFDFVISLCDKAQSECQKVTQGKQHLAWDFEDPKTRPGTDPFGVTLGELNARIRMFVLVNTKTK
ncbi:Protein-tyrosine-phosphatase [Hahella chejuensis KCTC 2396]|uniref:Protein-tyrosine-phosphatase n=1 Tax=Hahella chejuensis (strain KCTC 2396) TaxID=349521 RepID=Q2SPL0_HAHCH|nr:Protein-tyrosine-phosphatase [Hahella chejuensis KCTC 2396]